MQKQYEKYQVPQAIIIEQNKYCYKCFSIKSNLFTYRCIHRTCNCYIKISKEQIDLISDKNKNGNIIYNILNKHEHNIKEEIKITDKGNTRTVKEEEKLVISLIKQHIIQPLEFHIKNFDFNHIKYSYYHIKNLLQNVREADIPNNDIILSNIGNIKINFKLNDNPEDDVPFCLCKGEFINIRYKNRFGKYVIFSSLYQMKIASECNDFFLDGTFKTAPKDYYQILNIWGYKKNNNVFLPLANILLSHKSFELYDKVIKEILAILQYNNIKIDFSDKSIMSDFEHSLRMAIRNNMQFIKIRSCFFHYTKAIYRKCKYYHLFTKNKKMI